MNLSQLSKFEDWKNRICRGESETYWFGGLNKFPAGSHMRRVIFRMNVGWPVQSMLIKSWESYDTK